MNKITPEHLARAAYVYVRQSTGDQLLNNPESRRRQYALETRARSLGWESTLSSTMIWAGPAVVNSGRDSSVCWRQSVPALRARCWRSRHRG